MMLATSLATHLSKFPVPAKTYQSVFCNSSVITYDGGGALGLAAFASPPQTLRSIPRNIGMDSITDALADAVKNPVVSAVLIVRIVTTAWFATPSFSIFSNWESSKNRKNAANFRVFRVLF